MKLRHVCVLLVGFSFFSNGQINNPSTGLATTNSVSTTHDHREFKQNSTIQSNSLQAQQINFSNSVSQPAGQHTCKTFELNQAYYQSLGIQNEFNQDYLYHAQNINNLPIDKTSGVNEISIIFHVVHNPNNPAENVSNAQIMAVYNDLVEDFLLLNADATNARPAFTPANANINFCLATQDPAGTPLTELGVNRVATTEDWYDSDGGEENKMKFTAQGGVDSWGRDDYLNVWICDISNGASSGTAGYAYRPSPSWGLPSAGIDGIVLDYNLGVNNDNVLTHEVGHYLGLDHTWGGSGGCTNDDGFADTPQTAGPSFDYPGSCSGSQQTCGATETQYENYMDYANCTVMFTQEQADYMLYMLQNFRQSLMLSPGCDPVDAPPVLDFVADQTVIPVGGTVNFTSLSTNAPTSWTWDFNGGATNTTLENPSATFNTVGSYTVTHTATNAFGTGTETKVNHIQVVAPATGIACDTLRNWDPVDANTNGYYYYNSGGSWGYFPGHNEAGGASFFTYQYAEQFTATATAFVRRIRMPFFIASDQSGTGFIILKTYANDNGGLPGTVTDQDTVLIADLNEGFWNELDFSSTQQVTGTFFAGFEVFYGSPQDTVLVGMTDTQVGGNDSYFVDIDGVGWDDASTLLGITGSIAMDVLLSNGPAPVADFTASGNTVCEGGDITVNGSISTNTTNYYWYVTDDPFTTIYESSNTAGNTFNFPTAGNEQIFLFTDGSCLTDGVVLPVTIYTPVTATVTTTATTCGNNNGTITVSAPSGGDSTYFYSLDGINYQSGNTFSNLGPGNYDVYIATVGDNCDAMYTVNIASSSPIGASISPNQAVCPGESATITASGGTSYQWLDGTTVIGTNMSETVTPSTQTQYTCIVTDGAGCQSTVYTTVTVITPAAAPTISTSGSTTICAGTTVDLTSSYPTNNEWSTTETSSTITVNSAGSYFVTYTDANGCTSTSASTIVTVTPGPTIASGAVNGPTTCATATGSIEITGSGTGNISWTGSASGSQAGVSLPFTILGLAAGSYTITFTDATGCVSNQVTEALSDPTPPTTPTITAGGATTFCLGGSVILTSSYGTGNTWTTAETTNAITVTTSGSYSVTYTDGSGCSATSAPVLVTVNNNPAAPTITAGGSTTFCDGGSVTLTSSQGTGNVWSTTESTQSINATATGSYTVTYTDGNGCSATSVPLSVTVNPNPAAPTISTSGSTTFCQGGSVTLSSSEISGNVWSDNSTTQDITVSTSGSYTVTYTDGNGCSASSGTTVVVVNPLPTVTMSPIEDVCVYDAAFALTGGSPSGGTYSGNGVTANQFDPNSAGTGTQTITYSYTDGNGCSSDATTDIVVDDCLGIEDITSEINVYPNPVNDELVINLNGEFKYVITDARGRLISEGFANNTTLVDVKSYEFGVYFIIIHANEKSSAIRVVKQ